MLMPLGDLVIVQIQLPNVDDCACCVLDVCVNFYMYIGPFTSVSIYTYIYIYLYEDTSPHT